MFGDEIFKSFQSINQLINQYFLEWLK